MEATKEKTTENKLVLVPLRQRRENGEDEIRIERRMWHVWNCGWWKDGAQWRGLKRWLFFRDRRWKCRQNHQNWIFWNVGVWNGGTRWSWRRLRAFRQDQIWRGVVMKAESPCLFHKTVFSCEVVMVVGKGFFWSLGFALVSPSTRTTKTTHTRLDIWE